MIPTAAMPNDDTVRVEGSGVDTTFGLNSQVKSPASVKFGSIVIIGSAPPLKSLGPEEVPKPATSTQSESSAYGLRNGWSNNVMKLRCNGD